ncbi:MAG TPA: hypothetical protein VN597_10415 [Streptosporangiaceae bacterium]|nr:hypothetical protein [Streptosporangiaceae bacterium]
MFYASPAGYPEAAPADPGRRGLEAEPALPTGEEPPMFIGIGTIVVIVIIVLIILLIRRGI